MLDFDDSVVETIPPATPEQHFYLKELCIEAPATIHGIAADDLIRKERCQWEGLKPTEWQFLALTSFGGWKPGLTRGKAADQIDQIRQLASDEAYAKASVLVNKRPY